MGATPPVCKPSTTTPPDYSKQLSRGVPPVERAPTSLFPFQSIGPADVTWYFPIDVGTGFKATGVFIPQKFNYAEQVDVILYFHGSKLKEFQTINDYWGGNVEHITLRQDLNDSGRSAILIAPTLKEDPGYSNDQLGNFANPGFGLTFLDEVMDWLGKYEPRYALNCVKPRVRNVVLSGHSGGGNAIHHQLESMKTKVCEVWNFDVVYGEVSDWVSFAYYNPTKRLTFYWAVQSPGARKQLIELKDITNLGMLQMGLARTIDNLEIFQGAAHHFPCLTDNFVKQARRSRCLGSR